MIQNKKHFVPAQYRQPTMYEMFFGDWAAVYFHPDTGKEYHIQLNTEPFHNDKARSISLLVREEKCRRQLGPDYKTIKAAVADLDRIFTAAVAKKDADAA